MRYRLTRKKYRSLGVPRAEISFDRPSLLEPDNAGVRKRVEYRIWIEYEAPPSVCFKEELFLCHFLQKPLMMDTAESSTI